MGWFSSFVQDPLGTAVGTARKVTGTAADIVADTTSEAFKLGQKLGDTLINTAGDVVDKAGNVLAKSGDIVFKNSQIFDTLGNLIVPAGKLAYNGVGDILDKSGNVLIKAADVAKDVMKSDAGKIAIAAALPTMGASLATQLGLETALEGSALAESVGAKTAAKAVGTALANIGVQVASGAKLEDAVQNAGVSAVAATSSPYAANYINEIVKNPTLADAITSTGVSAAAGIALGNTPKNAFDYAIQYGPAASILTPEIGKAAATGVATYIATQDAAKAATATASVLGSEAAAEAAKTTAGATDGTKYAASTVPETTVSDVGGGGVAKDFISQLAIQDYKNTYGDAPTNAQLAVQIPQTIASQWAANYQFTTGSAPTDEQLVAWVNQAKQLWSSGQLDGVTSASELQNFAPTSTEKAVSGAGTAEEPTTVITPTLPTTLTDTLKTGATTATDLTKTPVTSVPTDITGAVETPSTTDTTATQAGAAQGVGSGSVSGSGQGAGVIAGPATGIQAGESSAGKLNLPKTFSESAPGKTTSVAATTSTETPEKTQAEISEVPVEDKTGTAVTRTPNIAIGTPGRSYSASITGPSSALARALQGDFYPTSTTGLTAYRPAGEIESEETGKQRQDVWNEASLRLKDALGI